MAFSFANAAGSGGFGQAQTSSGAQVHDGPELQEIQTDELGFSAINGEAKVRLLSSPWPDDDLPLPTSSLLSVASSKGFLAAAGPDSLIFASTESVRNAFRGEESTNNVKSFDATVRIPVPRLSQIAFSADEKDLIVSPQVHGGLMVYKVDALASGDTNPAMQISTNNTGLRALVPNPVSKSAELVAAVTLNGELLMVDLKTSSLRNGSSGPVLQTGVSCVSWSNKGKQLVAGLANGAATQMMPDGTIVAEVPKSTSIPSDYHVSAISWLENDSFFVVYTSNETTSDGMQPSSEYYIVSRQPKSSNYSFQRLPEVCPPFGMPRLPSFHFINRLRNFAPHLQDLLVLASTTSPDISLLSKTDSPLSKEEPVTEVFTLTTVNDDSRRAALPLSESRQDTSAIGVAMDLSSKESIVNPIPSDPEIPQSATPLPNLLALNHEGVLSSWWIVYNDSIRLKVAYSSLAAVSSSQDDQMQTASTPVQATSSDSPIVSITPNTFATSGFASTTPFAKPSMPAFGAPSSSASATGFGSTFGAPSAIGSGKSAWTSTGFDSGSAASRPSASGFGQPAFGSPAFGSSTPIGAAPAPAFGAASSLGSRANTFGQPNPSSSTSFGQSNFGIQPTSSFGGGSTQSPFAAASGGKPGTTGFAAFSQSNGFSALGAAKKGPESIFSKATDNTFTKADTSSPFSSATQSTSIFGGGSKAAPSSGHFGGGFKLESSFKGDGSAKDDLPKPANPGGFGFGGQSFEALLGESNKQLSPTHDTEADMDEREDSVSSDPVDAIENIRTHHVPPQTSEDPSRAIITPPSTIVHHKTTPAPPLSNLFGTSGQPQTTTPQAAQSVNSGWSFGTLPSTTPKDTPAPSHTSMFGTGTEPGTTPAAVQKSEPTRLFSSTPLSVSKPSSPPKRSASPVKAVHEPPKIKAEPPSDDEAVDLSSIPEAPLPPDPTSKDTYSPGDTSVSSNNTQVPPDDAPLPPDFVPANKSAIIDNQPELPDDDDGFSSDFGDSGDGVEEDVSPIEDSAAERTEQLLTSPESSFGRGGDKSTEESPTGGLFTKVMSTKAQKPLPRALFGEVGAGPIFVPPKSQESPRSPSPVRTSLHADLLRPEAPRSFSAPTRPPVLDRRKAELARSAMAQQAANEKEARIARDRAQADALARARSQAEIEAVEELEDDEDERLRAELDEPLEPSPDLYAFLPHQPVIAEDSSKTGIPGQIERLYHDINSMVITLGINARSLSAFTLYQQGDVEKSWPQSLKSGNAMDIVDDEWLLGDIARLRDGEAVLDQMLGSNKITNVASKLQQCHTLLSDDLHELRSKLTTMRKTLSLRSDTSSMLNAPLSAEQISIQHDLRKSSTSVQSKLAQAEECLTVLKAKLAEVSPPQERPGKGAFDRSSPQKRPTVEAVVKTVAKMTSMAEKKSADIDVLEAQLKRLNLGLSDSIRSDLVGSVAQSSATTPSRARGPSSHSALARSTGSAAGSVYHTPDSRFSASTRSTPGTGRKLAKMNAGGNGSTLVISAEDRELWVARAERRRKVADTLKQALAQRKIGG